MPATSTRPCLPYRHCHVCHVNMAMSTTSTRPCLPRRHGHACHIDTAMPAMSTRPCLLCLSGHVCYVYKAKSSMSLRCCFNAASSAYKIKKKRNYFSTAVQYVQQQTHFYKIQFPKVFMSCNISKRKFSRIV